MSQFTTPANLRLLDHEKWEVLTQFEYHVGSYPSNDVIRVPAGFVTDLASVPRMFWSVLPLHCEYAKAAIIHDYLYSIGLCGKRYADDVFLEAMTVLGVGMWRRKLMYFAVRLFGRGNFR